jgi:flavin reductase (DIM6/NTAB) family NADH-FMN oxidoreductase RutF
MKSSFYETPDLPKGLFKACIVPRPIGWISTVDINGGVNLAPFSFFNIVCEDPPMIMFSTTNAHVEGGPKDSLKNIEDTKEFVVNIATYNLREQVNLSSAELPRQENEFKHAGLECLASTLVKPPRVKESPIQLECVYYQSLQLPTSSSQNINRMIIGLVKGIHVDSEVLTDGLVDIEKLQPIARMGYNDYAVITHNNTFRMLRPS